MRRVLKWIGFALSGLLALILIAAVAIFVITTSRRSRTYDLKVAPVSIPTDESALARGEHIVKALAGKGTRYENPWPVCSSR